jgi:hypothetical protein
VNGELCWDAVNRFADDELEESGIDDSALEIISTMQCRRTIEDEE